MKLSRHFYNRKTLLVALGLLGKFLIHQIGKKKIVGMICETEAYRGPKDLASHASRGRTPRTEIMFGEPGQAYVYFIYGMYHCFNIVTERQDYPAAVLIRAVEPVFDRQGVTDKRGRPRSSSSSRQDMGVLPNHQMISGLITDRRARLRASRLNKFTARYLSNQRKISYIDGPGKVCRYFKIDKRLNGADLTGHKLWVEDRGVKIKKSAIHCGKRIGVVYAGRYKDKRWRFYI